MGTPRPRTSGGSPPGRRRPRRSGDDRRRGMRVDLDGLAGLRPNMRRRRAHGASPSRVGRLVLHEPVPDQLAVRPLGNPTGFIERLEEPCEAWQIVERNTWKIMMFQVIVR